MLQAARDRARAEVTARSWMHAAGTLATDGASVLAFGHRPANSGVSSSAVYRSVASVTSC